MLFRLQLTLGATMTQSEAKIARMIFYLAAVVSVSYGMLFLSVPEWQFELSQDPGAPQPLSRSQCEQAGRTWNEGANTCN
jgi:hypothetical protein